VKLFYSPASPFVRKVLACAITREIEGRIELVPTNAHTSPPALLAANPLSKVPALLTDDGLPLFDSPVICEYLDSVGGAPPLFPPAGGSRWLALRRQAVGDGMMDAAVLRRGESQRPKDAARDANMARQRAAVERGLAVLEADVPHQTVDIGTIAIACALGYLDFRYAAEPWRPAAPKLAAWFAAFGENPGLARTVPRDAT
jgi:glutathione S-transferase